MFVGCTFTLCIGCAEHTWKPEVVGKISGFVGKSAEGARRVPGKRKSFFPEVGYLYLLL